MTESEKVIREQLINLLKGGNAHLKTVDAIKNFPEGYINKIHSPISYTPWQLLEHIRIAQRDILEFIIDPNYVSPKWPEGYWPPISDLGDKEKWDISFNKFNEDFNSLLEMVNNQNIDLYSPILHAKDYTIFREILLVADHNAYHVGQLVLLKKLFS
ncbi:DinB family protein [Bacteroidota bacterium]